MVRPHHPGESHTDRVKIVADGPNLASHPIGNWQRISWEVWTPPACSATAAVSIFTVVWSWNDLFWPVIVLTDSDMMTIPVGLGTVLTSYANCSAQIMVSVVLVA